MIQDKKPLILIILDGWGHRESKKNNAIYEAKTPFFDYLWANFPHTLLNASEEHVGLPKGTIGNSEIGHMTMGAGRVIDTELVRISKALKNGDFEFNEGFNALLSHIKKNNSALHLIGMVSPIGVHSHQEHLHEIIKYCKKKQIQKIVIHAITDGRDSPPKEGFKYLKELENLLSDLGVGHIGSMTGRFFAMDRDKNWDRIEKAEKAIFDGHGEIVNNIKPSEILLKKYKDGQIDEYIEPIVFFDENGKNFPILDNDGIFFFNFRTDRPRQLSYKIMEKAKKQNLFFVTMTEYHPDIEALVAFPPQKPDTTLSAEISKTGLKQSHIAETEKYGHVTFFFNGGKQTPHENEQHFLIESRKDVKTHDQAPEMRAKEIADKTIERIKAGDDFIVLNFANADIVGHTANKPAIHKAVETIDSELKRIIEEIEKVKGIAIITADHGNAETNIDEKTGELHTAHTTNLVPFIFVSYNDTTRYTLHVKEGTLADTASTQTLPPLERGELRGDGTLADIAPTILKIMELKKPLSMTGASLLK